MNDEKVCYCVNCLSLRIKNIFGLDYCDECNSANIEQTSIEDWEKKCIEKNKEFRITKKNKYGRK